MSRNLTDQSEESLTAPTVGAHSEVEKLIPFRRGSRAPHPASAAGDDPLSSPAIPLGSVVQAVVMRLANKRIRLRVEGPSREEDRDLR
ncbi:hypothetical protein [Ensifer adhaerens]|uniref:hypothetical protein n=1 Tax=Ensifer adhaerens TaxID=106592 RepID=UPI00132F16E1|nr:hypothetical protein [Ensifer adhaerens]QHG70189.1 hypothetical protein DQW09_10170 [Ensifer adhaerens]